jgi:hypothetical protein
LQHHQYFHVLRLSIDGLDWRMQTDGHGMDWRVIEDGEDGQLSRINRGMTAAAIRVRMEMDE